MNVLHILQSVSPEQGGPIEALVSSDRAWRKEGHAREIVSLDVPGDPWVETCPLSVRAMGSARMRRWAKRVPALRYGYAPRLAPWLRTHAGRFDAVVVNGLWNYTAFAARRVLPGLSTPYFVFTHGMLDPWFRTAYPSKHMVKQLVWLLCEGPLLHGAAAVLFTNEAERKAAHGAFWPYRFPGVVTSYGTADPPPATAAQDLAFRVTVPSLGARYLLFLGRLHEKKGCDLLIEAFARCAQRHPGLDLVMAGPDSNGLRSELEALAVRRGLHSRVHWPGLLSGDAKWGALRGCEAFVLPSHGENFGVAVVEAMACGRPVLISDRVGVAGDVVKRGAGLVGPDTVEGTAALLARFLALPQAGRATMAHHARRCFEDVFDVERLAAESAAVLAGRGRP